MGTGPGVRRTARALAPVPHRLVMPLRWLAMLRRSWRLLLRLLMKSWLPEPLVPNFLRASVVPSCLAKAACSKWLRMLGCVPLSACATGFWSLLVAKRCVAPGALCSRSGSGLGDGAGTLLGPVPRLAAAASPTGGTHVA